MINIKKTLFAVIAASLSTSGFSASSINFTRGLVLPTTAAVDAIEVCSTDLGWNMAEQIIPDADVKTNAINYAGVSLSKGTFGGIKSKFLREFDFVFSDPNLSVMSDNTLLWIDNDTDYDNPRSDRFRVRFHRERKPFSITDFDIVSLVGPAMPYFGFAKIKIYERTDELGDVYHSYAFIKPSIQIPTSGKVYLTNETSGQRTGFYVNMNEIADCFEREVQNKLVSDNAANMKEWVRILNP